MYRIILPLFLFSFTFHVKAHFCNAKLSNIDPDLESRTEDFATKTLAQDKEATVWLTKHTGFYPKAIKKKAITEEKNIYIALPIEGKKTEETIYLTLQYEKFTRTINSQKSETTAIIKKIKAKKFDGSSYELDQKKIDEIIAFSSKAKPNEIITVDLFSNQKIDLVARISNNSFDNYLNFMKRFLFLSERNSTLRPLNRLVKINSNQDFIIYKSKLYINNAIKYIADRLKKHSGQLVGAGLLSFGYYLVNKSTNEPAIEVVLINMQNKKENIFQVKEQGDFIKFVPNNPEEYKNKTKVILKDLNGPATYHFSVHQDANDVIYLKIE